MVVLQMHLLFLAALLALQGGVNGSVSRRLLTGKLPAHKARAAPLPLPTQSVIKEQQQPSRPNRLDETEDGDQYYGEDAGRSEGGTSRSSTSFRLPSLPALFALSATSTRISNDCPCGFRYISSRNRCDVFASDSNFSRRRKSLDGAGPTGAGSPGSRRQRPRSAAASLGGGAAIGALGWDWHASSAANVDFVQQVASTENTRHVAGSALDGHKFTKSENDAPGSIRPGSTGES